MISFNELQEYIKQAKKVAPAIDFNELKFYVTTGPFIYSNGCKLRGEYVWGERITLAKSVTKKEGMAIFLHELGHHLVWLQFGELCKTFSQYEHEVFADKFATEMALELGFDYEQNIGRKAFDISRSLYSRKIPALNE